MAGKGKEEDVLSYINRQAQELQQAGKKVGILTTEENCARLNADVVLPCGRRSKPHTVAHQLYSTLRTFDEYEVDVIFSEIFPEKGLFSSVMNRLVKAAGERVISV